MTSEVQGQWSMNHGYCKNSHLLLLWWMNETVYGSGVILHHLENTFKYHNSHKHLQRIKKPPLKMHDLWTLGQHYLTLYEFLKRYPTDVNWRSGK